MPGAITNPQLNPLMSWMEYNHKVAGQEDEYNQQVAKGGRWLGTKWGGGPAPAVNDQYKRDMEQYQAGYTHTMPNMSDPKYAAAGGGATSLATGGSVAGGSGPYKGDAQLAQIRDDFRRMTESGLSGINEDLNQRGIFSSGVGAKLSGDYRTQMGQQEASAIERLMNDIMGRNQASELAKQQFEWQKQLAMMGGGGQRFSSGDTGGNQNDDLMALFQQMMGGGGAQPSGGYSSKGTSMSSGWKGNTGDLSQGSLPAGSTTGGQNALNDLIAQYNLMKQVHPAGAEALRAQIWALGGSV